MLKKDCGVCDHPERASVEEALDRGKPYQALTKQFRVSIGAMRRHRKSHLPTSAQAGFVASRESVRERPGAWTCIRLGHLPQGVSHNRRLGFAEKGVSVFLARVSKDGDSYEVEIPRSLSAINQAAQAEYLISLMLLGRPVYVAEGQEVEGAGGTGGEPLLRDVRLEPIPRNVRVGVPEWWGAAGQQFADEWNRGRRSHGHQSLHYGASLDSPLMRLAVRLAPKGARLLEEVWQLTHGEPLGICASRGDPQAEDFLRSVSGMERLGERVAKNNRKGKVCKA